MKRRDFLKTAMATASAVVVGPACAKDEGSSDVGSPDVPAVYPAQLEPLYAVAYSPDGKWLAVGVGGGVGPEQKGTVLLLDPATGKKIRELTPHHELGATDLAFHPDGKHLFSSGRDQHVKIWRLKDGQHVGNLGKPKKRGDWISSLSISPNGRRLAAADMSGKIVVYSLTDDSPAARDATAQ